MFVSLRRLTNQRWLVLGPAQGTVWAKFSWGVHSTCANPHRVRANRAGGPVHTWTHRDAPRTQHPGACAPRSKCDDSMTTLSAQGWHEASRALEIRTREVFIGTVQIPVQESKRCSKKELEWNHNRCPNPGWGRWVPTLPAKRTIC